MTVAIFGASGLVGTAVLDAYLSSGEQVVAVSRRQPEPSSREPYEHLALDLLEASAVNDALSHRTDIKQIVYAVVHEMPNLVRGWKNAEQMRINLAMLRNAIDPIAGGGGLEHVTLMQGTKAYGAHLHPIRVPSREREPRDDHDNFYWLQEDYVREQSATYGYKWTIFRPPLIVGPNHGVAMNMIPVIGAYAAIRKSEGLPFTYPGGPSYVAEALDVRVLADAILWASHTPAAQNQHFNISNGDVFQWRHMWPALGETLGLHTGPDESFSISKYLTERANIWDHVVREHGLRPLSLEQLLRQSLLYADFQFAANAHSPPPPALMSMVKLRQAGFHEVQDTELSFQYWLRELIARKVLPPPR